MSDNAPQHNLPLLGPLRKPVDLPWAIVEAAQNFRQMLAICIAMGRLKGQGNVADHLGLDRGQFSRVLSGSAHFPDDLCLPFCHVVGNWGIYQYRELERQRATNPTQERIAELEAELASLKESA